MSQPKVSIAITADDKTAKGAKSAEKRVGLIPKHLSANNRAWARETQATVSRTSSGMIRSFGNVERATARALGGRSVTSGITSRLGGIRAAAAEAATGLAGAAEAGGTMSMMLGGLGVVAGATVGILGSLAYGAFRLVDGWSKGAATIGRMADTMGVARKEMQQFVAASERMGVDKGTATGGIASLSQTLNDARYGRNNDALAILSKMGVKLQLHDDGTVDVEKMLPAIADAIARQNSSGRRTAAHALGLSDTMISVFAQGGKALATDMADAGRTAYMVDDEDIARAQRIQRKGTMVSQMKDRAMAWAGSEAANVAEPGYDAVLSGGRALMGSGGASFGGVVKNVFTPGARSVERGGAATERGGQAIERAAAGLTRGAITAAQRTQSKYGVPASITLGQYGLESSFGRRMPRGSNNPFGIKAKAGEPYVVARTREEDRWGRSYWINARFRKFDSLEEAFDAHARLLQGRRYAKARAATNSDDYADALQGTYATDTHYGQKLKSVIRRNDLGKYDRPSSTNIPVTVEVRLPNAPPGTSSTVQAGRGPRPAISHAVK
ncbi:glucosaminidase domain-containing protein [Sphingomonas sp. CBMAI 2297]|uniref:glycoside hydrolase family 73 protein n=1 Tax=Sphingomonas sp. CBMAI 2297 TaxID=2991720 RepID=UPI0024567252|nr:glucosaminidase domain-containing protein [Sphingomonas sp. CBMAI 2297]MDH4745821.1 glucosaminidase domain-containing protein [Sphingomonas sp. CBMAI 2297]